MFNKKLLTVEDLELRSESKSVPLLEVLGAFISLLFVFNWIIDIVLVTKPNCACSVFWTLPTAEHN